MASHSGRDYDTLLVQIVDYVYDKDITADQNALRMAKYSLLDSLGCASESIATNREVHKLIGPYVPGTIVPNGFRLPCTSLTLDPVKGAFDLGVLIRYLDHNDGFTGLEWGHPSGKQSSMFPEPDLTRLRRCTRCDMRSRRLYIPSRRKASHDQRHTHRTGQVLRNSGPSPASQQPEPARTRPRLLRTTRLMRCDQRANFAKPHPGPGVSRSVLLHPRQRPPSCIPPRSEHYSAKGVGSRECCQSSGAVGIARADGTTGCTDGPFRSALGV